MVDSIIKDDVVRVDTDKLIPYPNNPKKHPDEQIDKIAGSIQEYGFVQPLVVDDENQVVIGHGRLQASKKLGLDEVPVIKSGDLSDAQKKALRIADNRIAESGWDEELLAVELEELEDEDYDIDELGFEDEELSEIHDNEAEIEEDDFEYEEPDEVETDIERGDVFQLGEHRLMCGDATNEGDVDRLMGGNDMDLVVTSPPYFNQREYSYWDEYQDYLNFIKSTISNFKPAEKFAICWNIGDQCASEETFDIPANTSIILKDEGFKYRDKLIWKKKGAVWDIPRSQHIENGRYFPALAHESILVYTKKHPDFELKDTKKVREWQTNVWDINQVRTNNPEDNEGHPAQFPIELPFRCVMSYSKEGKNVYDPYAGSGTTGIACEQLDRKCYMMEIDPQYCQVIIDRWEDYTDEKAVKMNDD